MVVCVNFCLSLVQNSEERLRRIIEDFLDLRSSILSFSFLNVFSIKIVVYQSSVLQLNNNFCVPKFS